jgi:hypothetical protein
MASAYSTETADGYELHNSIPSKKWWCKGQGAKWRPETRTWLFPLKAATSTEALAEAYRAAPYDNGTRAAHHVKQRAAKLALQREIDAFKALKDAWIRDMTATDEIVEHSGRSSRCLRCVTGPNDEHLAIATVPYCGGYVRPRPGVLIYWVTYD